MKINLSNILFLFTFLFMPLQLIADSLDHGLKSLHESAPIQTSGKAVVFDAGSSGTRVYVYDWEMAKASGELPAISLKPGRTKKVSPGIATLSNNVDQILAYLKPLIDFAKDIVGKDISTTPLYFAGTAGLRLEQQRNPQGYGSVIAKVKEVLNDSGFKIAREPGPISGQEEGAFAWVAVNSLLKKLPKILLGEDLGTGIVEMGGASLQVAFLPAVAPKIKDYVIQLDHKKPLVLYAHSYGDLGQNEARAKFSNIAYCEWDHDFSNDAKAGDYDKCRADIVRKIIEAEGKECETCGIGAIFQPKLDDIAEEFYALGSLGFLSENFGLDVINAQNLRELGQKICNVPFSQAAKSMSGLGGKRELMETQCFNLAYYSAVLSGNEKVDENGIGFPGNSTKLISKNKIGSEEVSWTYGLLLLDLARH